MNADQKFAYRYYEQMYSGCSVSPSGHETYYPIGPKIELMEITILSFTLKGFWIADWRHPGFTSRDKRWIGNDHRKKYACLTKQEALESFKARKRRQASIYKARLDIAQKALAAAEEMIVQDS